MDFLGIGPLELLFIFIIVLIVLGPKDMVKTGQMLGRYLRQIMTSPTWKLIQETSREIRYLPNRLARQSGMEEFQQDLRQISQLTNMAELKNQLREDTLEAWTTPAESTASDETEDIPGQELPQNPEYKDQENNEPNVQLDR